MTRRRQNRSLGKGYDARLTIRLLRYFAHYRWAIAISIGLLLAVSGLQITGPYLTKVAIDRYIVVGDAAGLSWIAALFLMVVLSHFFLSFLQTYLVSWIGQRLTCDLRLEIFRHLMRLHQAYFDGTPAGHLVTRTTADVEVVNKVFAAGVVNIAGNLFAMAGIVAVMLWLDWRLAVAAFSVIPALLAATKVFRAKTRDCERRLRGSLANLSGLLHENLTGMTEVQIFAQEERKFAQFVKSNAELRAVELESVFYRSLFSPLAGFLAVFPVAVMLWYGGGQVLSETLTLGTLVAFIQYSERLYKPVSDLGEKFTVLQSAIASSERIFQLLDTRPEVPSPARPRALQEACSQIEFRDVWFAYQEGSPVLRGVSFKLSPGEKVAIVGHTGAGKSTIVNLLARLYDLQQGEIRIDGTDIRSIDQSVLRERMAVVFQDVFLFRGRVDENIRLWTRGIDSQQAQEAARQVHAHPFIQALPQGYATRLGERGTGLSAGQRQLLAFARALAHEPAILILDEATSSVDTQTEMLIRDALNRLVKNRTCLMVAHRFSTIQSCDRIIVLHKGRIQEQGSHEELLSLGGIYRKLHQLQYKSQNP